MINAEKELFVAVIIQAVRDATADDTPSQSAQAKLAKRTADAWLRRDQTDFLTVCSLAGVDPDGLREAYVAGKIDRSRMVITYSGHMADRVGAA